jgi:hypothetical protein
MARRKFSPIFTLNTLESMIEYTINLKHTWENMWDDTKTLGMSKRWQLFTPPPTIVRNKNMGKRTEKNNWQNRWMGDLVMGKCKDRQRKSCNIETNCKHSKGGYGILPLGDVYTRHGFFF